MNEAGGAPEATEISMEHPETVEVAVDGPVRIEIVGHESSTETLALGPDHTATPLAGIEATTAPEPPVTLHNYLDATPVTLPATARLELVRPLEVEPPVVTITEPTTTRAKPPRGIAGVAYKLETGGRAAA